MSLLIINGLIILFIIVARDCLPQKNNVKKIKKQKTKQNIKQNNNNASEMRRQVMSVTIMSVKARCQWLHSTVNNKQQE